MKDTEQRLGMADGLPEFEKTPTDPEQFVVEGVTEVGGAMLRWSVGPALDIDRSLLLKDPAKALSRVPVEDPNLRFTPEELKNPTDETLSLAIPLVLAKVEQVGQEKTLSPKEERGLEKARKLALSLLGPKGRNTAAALAMLTAACSPAITPEITPPTAILEPTPTVFFEPTPSPEVIANLESLVQVKLDETFPTLGLHETRMEGLGFLTDSEGRNYALFATLLPDPNTGFNLELLLLSQVSEDYQISWVKGLVVDTQAQSGGTIEFLGITYDTLNNQFVVEGPLLRTNTQTGTIEIFKNGAWEELKGNRDTVEQVMAKLGSGVLAAPALPSPTSEPTPTPTEVPPPYEIVEGYREEIREEVLGVPVSIDIVTDVSLQDRHPANHPVEKLYLNTTVYPDAAQNVAEATMIAIWYAWKDDMPEERADITFEEYMQMVKEYLDGSRPLEDVQYEVWANDLLTSEFKTERFMFDPSQPIKIVYLDDPATENISYVGPGKRLANQRNKDGNLEFWLAYPTDRGRGSFRATYLYTEALNRLTWPSEYQSARPKRPTGDEEFLADTYQPEILKTLIPRFGVINIVPNDVGK